MLNLLVVKFQIDVVTNRYLYSTTRNVVDSNNNNNKNNI